MKKILTLSVLTLIAISGSSAFGWFGRGCRTRCCAPTCCPEVKEVCEDKPMCEKVVCSTVCAEPCAHRECITTYTCPDGYEKKSCATEGEEVIVRQ